jgi:transposase
MPWCDTEAMQAHLEEISTQVAHGAHAVLILDRAGWHISHDLRVPDNITLLPLPPRSPELNPTENVWQFLRDNHLSNRIFQSYEEIVAHCCDAWSTLMEQPWRIRSIGLREWAHGF